MGIFWPEIYKSLYSYVQTKNLLSTRQMILFFLDQ